MSRTPTHVELRADLDIDLDAPATRVDAEIYGQYVEHVEDCVYPALHRDGAVREDVIESARDLGVPVVRWPGGCFADVYHWRDGVGPAAQRPLRRNWHWGGTDSNLFGTDEFLSWSERAGAAPYVNVNLGTGTLDEALAWLDYCNGTEPTPEVLRRRANGRQEPWNVRLWGIGNETWGHWEAGHTDAATYARTLANWADFFKRYDPGLSIVGVGSNYADDPEWDTTVLEQAGRYIDYLSLHVYGGLVQGRDDARSVVCTPVYLEDRIRRMAGVVRRYNAARPDAAPVRIAIDEWNIRHYRDRPDGTRELVRSSPRGPLDVLFTAGVFHAMIRHGDVVGMANYVFLVNGHGVIVARDDDAHGSALFPVFQLYRRYLTGAGLPVRVDGPRIAMPAPIGGKGSHIDDAESLPGTIDALDVVAVRGDDGGVNLGIVNRHPDRTIELRLPAVADLHTARIDSLTAPDGERTVRSAEPGALSVPAMSVTIVRLPGPAAGAAANG